MGSWWLRPILSLEDAVVAIAAQLVELLCDTVGPGYSQPSRLGFVGQAIEEATIARRKIRAAALDEARQSAATDPQLRLRISPCSTGESAYT